MHVTYGPCSPRSHVTLRTVGLEDLDEAVERRALELATEVASSAHRDFSALHLTRLLLLLFQEKLNPSFRPGYFITPWSDSPKWPFQLIQNRDKQDTGVIALAAPFVKKYFNVRGSSGFGPSMAVSLIW